MLSQVSEAVLTAVHPADAGWINYLRSRLLRLGLSFNRVIKNQSTRRGSWKSMLDSDGLVVKVIG